MYRKGPIALIFNNRHELLVVNLVSFKDEEEKFFTMPGGGLEDGETLIESVYREIKEEVGIDKRRLELAGSSSTPIVYNFKTKWVLQDGREYLGQEKYYFGFRFIGDDKDITPQQEEVRSYKWVSVENLKEYLLFENQLEDTLKKITEIFGAPN